MSLRQALLASKHEALVAPSSATRVFDFNSDGMQEIEGILGDDGVVRLGAAVNAVLDSTKLSSSSAQHENFAWRESSFGGLAIARNGNRWELTITAGQSDHRAWIADMLGGAEKLNDLLGRVGSVMPPRAELIRAGFVVALPVSRNHPDKRQDIHADLSPTTDTGAPNDLNPHQSCTLLVPLDNVESCKGMGGTQLLLGSHWHAKDSSRFEDLKGAFDSDALPVGIKQPLVSVTRRGHGYVLDSFVLHRGLANESTTAKRLLYLVCSTPSALQAATEADRQNGNVVAAPKAKPKPSRGVGKRKR